MNETKQIFPKFYKTFKCIADKCPDSCCKDWDVVVDDDSADFYNTVDGKFGDKLRRLMITDSDGDRIFEVQNGKCPFWNDKMLCDIYIHCGEEHLCHTCREFPRLAQDYTAFTEHMLSFACPEAARIMLTTPDCFDCIELFEVYGDNLGYPTEMMNFLLAARKASCNFFDTDEDFQTQLCRCYGFNERVQAKLDSEDFEISALQSITNCTPLNMPCSDKIFSLHKKLDIMDKQFFDDIQKSKNSIPLKSEKLDSELRILAKYYFFRYYLTAIDSYDVITTLNRIACASTVISSLAAYKNAVDSFENRIMIFQQYSKEIEHSYENTDCLTRFTASF